MNLFRLVGDLSHLAAILILLLKIWKTRSCAGISGKQKIFKIFFLNHIWFQQVCQFQKNLWNLVLEVYFIEIEALFVQLNQNVTTDCHVTYTFFTPNCLRNNLITKLLNQWQSHVMVWFDSKILRWFYEIKTFFM